MKHIISHSDSPSFNLALEEYFFNQSDDNFFLIYINKPSIIIGKHQIPCKETDIICSFENNIPIYRRFSGGGTVYHDPGNINFCFIKHLASDSVSIDFSIYTKIITDYLLTLKLDVTTNERNNILIGTKKISGNAQHISRKKVLHHGTLLFNSDLNKLRSMTHVSQTEYIDKSVKSISSETTNIFNHLTYKMNISEFVKGLVKFVNINLLSEQFHLTQKMISDIQRLAISKYESDEWTYGYSPDYTLYKDTSFQEHRIRFSMKVSKGIISDFNIEHDANEIIGFTSNHLIGKLHTPVNIFGAIEMLPNNFFHGNSDKKSIGRIFF